MADPLSGSVELACDLVVSRHHLTPPDDPECRANVPLSTLTVASEESRPDSERVATAHAPFTGQRHPDMMPELVVDCACGRLAIDG